MRPPPSLLLRAIRRPESCEPAVRLFVRQGIPPRLLRKWCEEGEVFVLFDLAEGPDDGPRAAAVAIPVVPGRVSELAMVAAVDDPAGLLAGRIVSDVLDVLRARGFRRVVAAASTAQLRRMELLRAAGFRSSEMERNGTTVIWFVRDL